MAEENDAQEGDVEAEMLRTMQEELGGAEGGDAAADAGGDAAEGGGDVDNLLEEEMLKAMEQKGGGGDAGMDPMAALSGFGGAPSAVDFAEGAEGVDRLTDVMVEITVELGDNLIPIQEIMEWASGSVVELQPEEHETVKVYLNGSPFARGEIVVVGDTFGVRIAELLDPNDSVHH